MNGSLLADEARRDLAALSQLNTPVRAVRRHYSKMLASAPPQTVLRFVRSLLANAGWAERVVAWEVLAGHAATFGRLNDRLVEQMSQGLAADWGRSISMV